MSDIVKTYRVVRTELKVGDSVRQYGDFVPEAESWQNLHAYLRNDYIEVCYVSQKDIDANILAIKNRVVEEDDVVFEETETPSLVSEPLDINGKPYPPVMDHADNTAVAVTEKPKSKTVKRSTKKPPKIVRRSKNDGESGNEVNNGPVLEESTV